MTACILVVDEHVWARQALCAVLEASGYHTEQAADLTDVHQRLRRAGNNRRPDLTLVELVRDRGNGFSLAAWLQAHGCGVVVLLSDRDDEADHLWAQSRGIRHTWSRAQGLDALRQQVHDMLAAPAGTGREAPRQAQPTGPWP
ncbi:MAG: response regulator [Pseudohongiella sp.]|uniref:response regulator n=1 Tax=Pseudohongiella sp. TaxID=1979412 RepID=UPI0034A014E8